MLNNNKLALKAKTVPITIVIEPKFFKKLGIEMGILFKQLYRWNLFQGTSGPLIRGV